MSEILIDKAPPIFGSPDAYFAFPSHEHFVELAMPFIREEFPETDYPTLEDIPEDDFWVARNAISHQKDNYFRKRCRDEVVRYSIDGKTPESFEYYMQESLYSSALFAALYAHEQAPEGSEEKELYRQRIVFTGAIHINDAIQRSLAFLDPRLKNDGLVRTKHFMGFLGRAEYLGQFAVTPEEKAEVGAQRAGLQLAVAEIGAQQPVNLLNDLWLMETTLLESGERSFYHNARSETMNLSALDRTDKLRVISRYQEAARQNLPTDCVDDFFLMQLLHLYGLTTAADYYDPDTYEPSYRWFNMQPENILERVLPTNQQADSESYIETFDQEPLF